MKTKAFLNKIKKIRFFKESRTFPIELIKPPKSQFDFYYRNKKNLKKFYNFMDNFQVQADQNYH